MLGSSRVVVLRSSKLQVRILVLPKNELIYMTSYMYSESPYSNQIQIVYTFCENYLTEVIPRVVSMVTEDRQTLLNELYKSIVELNPELAKSNRPVFSPPGGAIVKEVKPSPIKQKKDKNPLVVSMERVKSMHSSLGETIYGQDDALKLIQEYFECSMAGISDDSRPRGSFIFIGDSGVGKTACVKEIARHFFRERWKEGLFVINGSEMMEEHETARLLGSPQGYVGYDDGSPFLKHVAENPECIVLFDEFEKAHPKAQDVFLQILDEGFCNDNKGNRVDFTKTFVVFTSNIGTKELYHKKPVGFTSVDAKSEAAVYIDSALRKFCRIEFLKRFDGIVVFNQLGEDSRLRICEAEVNKLGEKVSEKGFKMRVSPKVYSFLLSELSREDTARDLKTVVKRHVGAKIAKLIVSNETFDIIKVDVLDGEVTVTGVENGKKKTG